ncbi:hypothetical protein ECZU42_51280 [Escherichia coli]|nr:hypothetical protein ECZU42_51280 [Escherichia coli]
MIVSGDGAYSRVTPFVTCCAISASEAKMAIATSISSNVKPARALSLLASHGAKPGAS